MKALLNKTYLVLRTLTAPGALNLFLILKRALLEAKDAALPGDKATRHVSLLLRVKKLLTKTKQGLLCFVRAVSHKTS